MCGDEDEFVLLSKCGLIPGTDSVLVYPEPGLSEGRYQLEFFVHGIRHMHSSASKWCEEVEQGERLFPLLDVQNPVDPNAVALGRKGGKARLQKLTPEQRTDIARKAVIARWNKAKKQKPE